MSYIQGPTGGGGVGTVTSVGLSLPNIFTVSGSPVTGSGTLTAVLATESANTVFAGPASGAAATPTFRALVAADVPGSILPGGFTGFANPTASVGLTAVNGSATTAMRSDAAPALASTISAAGPIGSATIVPVITFNAAGQLTTVTTTSITQPTGANPTASVGLTAVNGSAATFMRSDAAPPLDVTPAYAFSGLAATAITASASASIPLAITGYSLTGSQQQSMVDWTGTLNTSGSPDVIALRITDTARGASTKLFNLYAGAAGATTKFSVDRNGNTTTAGLVTANGGLSVAAGQVLTVGTAILFNPSGVIWQLGTANAASPVAQTMQAQGSRAGTDANTAGAGLTIRPGIGTGNVGTATLTLQGIIGNATTTTTAQTTAAGISIPGVASGQLPGAVIGSAAIATNATDGFLYIASGAGAPTGTPTAFTGRVPLYYDSTNDQLYIYRASWKQPKTPAGAAVVTWQ